mgnify:CR=1 FL=1
MNEDGVVDEKDKTILGNPNPDFTYGFQTRIAWKDLSVSASFNGVHGNQILNRISVIIRPLGKLVI